MTLVLLTWADAHAGPHEWSDPDDLGDDGEYLVRSLGHLLAVGEGGKPDHVTLAQSISAEGLVDHVLHVPCGMVRLMQVVSVDD